MGRDKSKRRAEPDHQKDDAEHRPASSDLADAIEASDDQRDEYVPLVNEHAHVIGASRAGAGVEIVVNRGREDGVEQGTKGVVAGLDVSFVVHTVYGTSSAAFVEATWEQINQHKHVVLNPS